jgi:hypothetical protein
MCERRPCWGTLEEAKKLINSGFADRLMVDYWVSIEGVSDDGNIYLVSPAIRGFEKGFAPDRPTGVCTFLGFDNKCELHDLGLKPQEGRVVDHDTKHAESYDLRKNITDTWNTVEGQAVVENWKVSQNLS